MENKIPYSKVMDSKVTTRKRYTIPGIRYLFAFNGFLGYCVLYAIRVNINVAIVAMVNGTAVYDHDNDTKSEECKIEPPPFITNSSSFEPIPEDGEFLWSPKLQGVILGAFYYGYCISQVPGGRLAEIFSGKWVFGIGTVITAFLTLLSPLAARYHVGYLIAIRALEGLSQGVTMPAMHSMLGRWLPDSEKGLLNTIVYAGINVGTVTAMPMSGALCRSDWFGGWPAAFYVTGIVGCFWFVTWCLLVTDSPYTHPLISEKELKYISSNQTIAQNTKPPPIPWKKILTSVPALALIISQTGQDWYFYTIVNDLPTYFSTILHFEIEKSGFLSSFPHLVQSGVGIIVGLIADAIVRKKLVSTNFVRKFCNSVSGFGCSFGLLGVCFAGCNGTLNVALFILSVGIGGFAYSGYMLSHLDLSPEYAGTLMGLANTVSNLTGFIAPLVVGALTEKSQTINQWRIAFFITSGICLLSTTIFLFFVTAEKQDWVQKESEDMSVNSEKEESERRNSYGTINP